MKEKVICLPSSDLGYLSRLVCEDVERLRQSLRTGDYFDRRSQEMLFKHAMELYERLGNCEREIPTINPEDMRPKGRWIDFSEPDTPAWDRVYRCSNCGKIVVYHNFVFCPECGIKMEVEK